MENFGRQWWPVAALKVMLSLAEEIPLFKQCSALVNIIGSALNQTRNPFRAWLASVVSPTELSKW